MSIHTYDLPLSDYKFMLLAKEDARELGGWPHGECSKYVSKPNARRPVYSFPLCRTGAGLLHSWHSTNSYADSNQSFVLAGYLEENQDTFLAANPDWPDWATEAYEDTILFLKNRSSGALGANLLQQEQDRAVKAAKAERVASAALEGR